MPRGVPASAGRVVLEEGAQSRLPFGARPARGRDVRGVDVARAFAYQALRLAHGLGAAFAERLDDLLGGGARVLGHLLHEPDAQGDVWTEALAGEEVASCRGSDLRENERRDHGRDDPEPDLREAE